ncbi:MAG: hypothetical protein KJ799_10075 [Bacteroidetes bacterium]|nr:hypothetical protein [Bacteroidota bacterium]
MNRIIIILILSVPFSALISQDDFKVYKELSIEPENMIFQIGQKIIDGFVIMNNGEGRLFYEKIGITRDEMSESKPVNITLRISGLKGNLIKDISLEYNDIDIDMAQFSASYFGEKKFLVITVRYRFYIIGIEDFKVIGPFFPKLKGYRLDAISGSLNNFKLFDDGKYFFGIAADNGVFCYKLIDLYNPTEIDGYNIEPIYTSSNSFFIDNRIDNLYYGIYVHNTSNNIDEIKYLFKSIRIEKMYELDNQYIFFKYFNKENELVNLVVDYKNGRLLDNNNDRQLIYKLLKNINE